MDKYTGVRAQYYDPKAESDAAAVDTGTDSFVQQSFKDEVDVNTIARRFGITGAMAFGTSAQPMYGDFTGISDFDSAVAMVEDARSRFMRLPAEVREEFGNNPGNLVRFANEASPEEFAEFFAPERVADTPAPGVDEPE